MSQSGDKEVVRARYRGVYRCGRRWKAQLQSHGIQFYLGMYDTEEEAARAYDRKAREEKSNKQLLNFGPAEELFRYGNEANCVNGAYIPPSMAINGNINPDYNLKRSFDEISEKDPKFVDYKSTTENMRALWDRQCQVAQRLLLAKAAQSKLVDLQSVAPDSEKENLLAALNEELVLLAVVKAQLEEAVSRCFTMGLDVNSSENMPSTVYGNHGMPMDNLRSPLNARQPREHRESREYAGSTKTTRSAQVASGGAYMTGAYPGATSLSYDSSSYPPYLPEQTVYGAAGSSSVRKHLVNDGGDAQKQVSQQQPPHLQQQSVGLYGYSNMSPADLNSQYGFDINNTNIYSMAMPIRVSSGGYGSIAMPSMQQSDYGNSSVQADAYSHMTGNPYPSAAGGCNHPAMNSFSAPPNSSNTDSRLYSNALSTASRIYGGSSVVAAINSGHSVGGGGGRDGTESGLTAQMPMSSSGMYELGSFKDITAGPSLLRSGYGIDPPAGTSVSAAVPNTVAGGASNAGGGGDESGGKPRVGTGTTEEQTSGLLPPLSQLPLPLPIPAPLVPTFNGRGGTAAEAKAGSQPTKSSHDHNVMQQTASMVRLQGGEAAPNSTDIKKERALVFSQLNGVFPFSLSSQPSQQIGLSADPSYPFFVKSAWTVDPKGVQQPQHQRQSAVTTSTPAAVAATTTAAATAPKAKGAFRPIPRVRDIPKPTLTQQQQPSADGTKPLSASPHSFQQPQKQQNQQFPQLSQYNDNKGSVPAHVLVSAQFEPPASVGMSNPSSSSTAQANQQGHHRTQQQGAVNGINREGVNK